MEWDRGAQFSAVLHGGLIVWALLGGWLFAPDDMPDMQVAQVSMVSEDDFKALMDAAPKPDKPDPDKPAPDKPAPRVEPPKPLDLTEPEPAPIPEPLPESDPVAADPQPIEAPDPVAPLAPEEQPIPVPDSSLAPKPRPSERVAAVPVDAATDAQDLADTVTPETSDQAAPDAPVLTEDQPEASPLAASTQIVTEATETDENAPQLAPTASRRPQSRPEKPVEVAQEPPEVIPPEEGTDEAPPEETPSEEDAIVAALAEATQTPDDTGGVDENLPVGPKMSASDVEGLRIAVNKCWSVGILSTDAMNTMIRLRFELDQNGKPVDGSFQLLGFEGTSEAAAQLVYETGVRAVRRCAGPSGYDLPPEKFEDWRIVNIEFDPNGMRLR